jgi:Flp pilus assembly protein protease CpaA
MTEIVPALLSGCAGGLVGLGSGWLSVRLERMEKLEEEENEERVEYEASVAKTAAEAEEKGEEPPEALPWLPERYGWTWLERCLNPALTAFGFALFAGREGVTLLMFEHLLWVAVFSHIIVFDLKHRLILNRITYPAVPLTLVLAAVTPGLSLSRALTGAVCIGAFFLLFSLVSRGGIGLGDAKLGALMGAVNGLSFDSVEHLQAISAVVAAIFLGGAVSIVLLVTRVRGLKDPIPYGPFLCAGAVLVLYQTT